MIINEIEIDTWYLDVDNDYAMYTNKEVQYASTNKYIWSIEELKYDKEDPDSKYFFKRKASLIEIEYYRLYVE